MAISRSDMFDEIKKFAKYLSSYVGEDIEVGQVIGPIPLKSLWRDDNSLSDCVGIYTYSLPSGEVVYVGMGHVRARVWRHLRTPNNLKVEGSLKEQGFPEHRWGRGVRPEIHEAFSQGTMLAAAVPVSPRPLIRALEGFAIWRLMKEPQWLNARKFFMKF